MSGGIVDKGRDGGASAARGAAAIGGGAKRGRERGMSPFRLSMRRLARDRSAMVAAAIITAFIATALVAGTGAFGIKEAATVFNENSLDTMRYLPVGTEGHVLGTDGFGRDVLARSIMGIRTALYLGYLAGLMTVPIALLLGAVAGWYGGLLDDAVTWLMSVVVAVPGILLIMSLIQIVGKSFTTMAFAFAVTGWVGLARVVRGAFLQARESEYVLAARALGAGDARIVFRHVLPNVFHFVTVNFVLQFVGVVKSEVFLAFVGLTLVGEATWGSMIDAARSEVSSGRWQNLIGPTLFMGIFLMAMTVFGDSLRDALDPKLKNAEEVRS